MSNEFDVAANTRQVVRRRAFTISRGLISWSAIAISFCCDLMREASYHRALGTALHRSAYGKVFAYQRGAIINLT